MLELQKLGENLCGLYINFLPHVSLPSPGCSSLWENDPSLLPTELCLLKFIGGSMCSNGTVFGDGAFKEVMKIKWSHKGEVLSQ